MGFRLTVCLWQSLKKASTAVDAFFRFIMLLWLWHQLLPPEHRPVLARGVGTLEVHRVRTACRWALTYI